MFENFFNINLTRMQFGFLCGFFMLLCFVSIGCILVKSLLKVILQANVQNEKKEQVWLQKKSDEEKKKKEEVSLKKGFVLISSILCVFGIMDYFTDSIPVIFKLSEKLGVSFSLFLLVIALIGIFLVVFYIPYKTLKIILEHAKMADVDEEKENNK